MVSLRDGNRLVPLNKDKSSVEVGDPNLLVQVLQTLKAAVTAGELDGQLETLIAARKPPTTQKPKTAEAGCVSIQLAKCINQALPGSLAGFLHV